MKNNTFSHTKNGSVIIVGASLSGLMAGIALAQEGIYVHILEKSDEDRPVGAGLQVDGGTFITSKTERLLRKLASGGERSVQLWGAIESRLRIYAKSDNRIQLHYNTRVKSVGQNKKSVWAKAENDEIFHGDVLIGADGHRSIVRKHVAPHKPDATFAGFIVWIASANESDLPGDIKLPSQESKGYNVRWGY